MSAAPKNAASNPTSKSLNLLFRYRVSPFLATLVVLHFTPVSKSLGGSQFRTSVAWSLQACFFMFACVIMQDCVAVLSHVMVLTCYIVLARDFVFVVLLYFSLSFAHRHHSQDRWQGNS